MNQKSTKILLSSFLLPILIFMVSCFIVYSLSFLYTFEAIGLTQQDVFNGEVWRLSTYAFAHVSSDHLLGNLLSILFLAALIYPSNKNSNLVLNWQNSTAIILLGVIGSGVFTILFQTENTIIIGSSGVVYSFAGFSLFKILYEKNWPFLLIILPWLAFSFVVNFQPGVSALSHLGGFICGAAYFIFISNKSKTVSNHNLVYEALL